MAGDRYKDEKFIGWLTVQLSLIFAKEGVEQFSDDEVKTFHDNIKHNIPSSSAPGPHTCIDNTKSRQDKRKLTQEWQNGKFSCQADNCHLWLGGIGKEYFGSPKSVEWDNCNLAQLSTVPWACAKLYMPYGSASYTQASDADIASLLTLFLRCIHFRKFFNQVDVCQKVKDIRNQMMHTCKMEVDATSVTAYTTQIIEFLEDPKHLLHQPHCQEAVRKIKELLSGKTEISLNKELELRVLNTELHNLVDVVKALQSKVKDTGADAASNSEDLKTLKTKLALVQSRSEDFNKFLTDYKIKGVSMEKLSEVNIKIARLGFQIRVQLSKLTDRVAKLEIHRKTLTKEQSGQKHRLDELKKDVSREQESQKQKQDVLQAGISDLGKEQSGQNQRLHQLERGMSDIRQEQQQLKRDVQEFLIQSGKGIAKLNIQPKSEETNQRSTRSQLNSYISPETQAAAGPSGEPGQAQVPAWRQEVGTSMEESGETLGESPGDDDLVLQNVCSAEEDMDTGLNNMAAPSGAQDSRATGNPTDCRRDHQGCNVSEGSVSELPCNGSAGPLNRGYTGDLAEEYRMESEPRGLLLIINNKTFRGYNDRDGTDVDCRNLRTLFMSMGFGVDVRHNLTALEIRVNLAILSKHDQLRDVDCLAIAILTHGTEFEREEYLYGVDGKCINKKEAFQPFNAENCPALHDKPKFFIINACRGVSEDRGNEASVTYESSVVQDSIPTVPRDSVTFTPDPATFTRISNMQDFLLAYSTIPGHVSWRHMNDGSWFIQGLVKVFRDCADRKDVLSMLTKVNAEVSRNIGNVGVQIPAPVFTLTKTWYLNPSPRVVPS